MSPQDDGIEKSAFEEAVTFADVEALKKDALLQPEAFTSKEPVNLVTKEADRLEITHKAYQAVMSLLRNFTNVDYSIVLQFKSQI